MDTTPPQTPDPNNAGCGYELAFLGASFVLPFANPDFYRDASRRGLGKALLFFIIFMLSVSVLRTIGFINALPIIQEQAQKRYETAGSPVITIANGTASTDSPEPIIFYDQDAVFFAVDTQGKIAEDDLGEYLQVLLLTENALLLTDFRGTQTMPYTDFHLAFDTDPIILDQNWLDQALEVIYSFYSVVFGVGYTFWNIAIRYLYLMVLAGFIAGMRRATRRKGSYKQILIFGIYSLLPAMSISYLIALLGSPIWMLETTLLLLFWNGALFFTFGPSPIRFGEDSEKTDPPEEEPVPEEPLIFWPTIFGFPLLIILGMNLALPLERGPHIAWGIFIPTLIALVYFCNWYGVTFDPEEID